MGIAAETWLTYMDRLLTLGDDRAAEKNSLKTKMVKLIDIYYDALDAPKSGKKVNLGICCFIIAFTFLYGYVKCVSLWIYAILNPYYSFYASSEYTNLSAYWFPIKSEGSPKILWIYISDY